MVSQLYLTFIIIIIVAKLIEQILANLFFSPPEHHKLGNALFEQLDGPNNNDHLNHRSQIIILM
jgi:hypothetical protein